MITGCHVVLTFPPHNPPIILDRCHCPSYVYRLLTEMYSPEDYTL